MLIVRLNLGICIRIWYMQHVDKKKCRIVLNAFKKHTTVIMETLKQKIYLVYLRECNCFFT